MTDWLLGFGRLLGLALVDLGVQPIRLCPATGVVTCIGGTGWFVSGFWTIRIGV